MYFTFLNSQSLLEEKTCYESATADLQMEVQSLREDKNLLQTKEQVSNIINLLFNKLIKQF